jgi:hypothetical protein
VRVVEYRGHGRPIAVCVQEQREDLDRAIAALIDRDDDWRGKLELLKSSPAWAT